MIYRYLKGRKGILILPYVLKTSTNLHLFLKEKIIFISCTYNSSIPTPNQPLLP